MTVLLDQTCLYLTCDCGLRLTFHLETLERVLPLHGHCPFCHRGLTLSKNTQGEVCVSTKTS